MQATTHTITVACTGRNPHGPAEQSEVVVHGDGGIEHWLQAFAAALVAAGFATDTAARILAVEV